MKSIRELFLVFFTVLSLAAPRSAAAIGEFDCKSELKPKAAEASVGKVEKRYEKFSDLEARFLQRSFFVGLGRHVISKGSVLFKKPGMMDWRYEEPDEQRFIADGETLWFFQPELNQVTVGAFTQAFQSDLPVSFLLGVGSLSENFVLKKACTSESGIVLTMTSREKDPNLENFQLLVRKDDFVPIGAKVIDIGGNETEILFDEVSFEKEFKEEQFSFRIPRGVDVIDHRKKERTRVRLLQ